MGGLAWKGRSFEPTTRFNYFKSSWNCINPGTGPFAILTIPTVQWYVRNDLLDDPIPIQNKWHSYRQQYMSSDNGLPPGWTKHEYTTDRYDIKERNLFPEGIPSHYFTHEADSETQFWHPIPLSSTDRTSVTNSLGGLISCRTQRAWFSTSEEFVDDRQRVYVSLFDAQMA